jgi:hypothetical protein
VYTKYHLFRNDVISVCALTDRSRDQAGRDPPPHLKTSVCVVPRHPQSNMTSFVASESDPPHGIVPSSSLPTLPS